MDDFINVTKNDPQVQMKMKDILDKYIKLPFNYQSKLGCDTLIQNVILEELINIMGASIVDLDRELKLKISRIKYLECRLF